MSEARSTRPDGVLRKAGRRAPGMVVVFSGGAPAQVCLPVLAAPVTLGRDMVPNGDLRMSRRHAEVLRREGQWVVRDLDSRNGTFVDGEPLAGERQLENPRVLRVGSTVLTFREDLRALDTPVTVEDGRVRGPRLEAAWKIIAREAAGGLLHITGETGSGKELAARHFHASGARPAGPFIAVNCASIPAQLAERLFFGARRGAYSDATDADGYLQSADGGTLFLDEVAELPLELQAKLLRVVESREVVPLGATRGQRVDLRICSATHHNLAALVEEGKFRRDLYHRLGQPAVELPPLREFPEEVSWLVRAVVGKLEVDAGFIEEAMLRPWPGNVRELQTAVGSALRAAAKEGVLEARHLPRAASAKISDSEERRSNPGRQMLIDALRENGGNVTAAARSLGTWPTQMRRWMARHGVKKTDE